MITFKRNPKTGIVESYKDGKYYGEVHAFGDSPEDFHVIKKETERNMVRGCLIGGAIGDALGYAVEFKSEDEIFAKYGKDGITEYELRDGKALISDDTQMTLFTAVGLLVGETRGELRGISANPSNYVAYAYMDWLLTQKLSYDEVDREEFHYTWLLDVPELFARRAPGMTCLSAISKERVNTNDYIKNPPNDSKGCGGVMRVAPLAILQNRYQKYYADLDMEAAQIAAITHGHSLGYMPAAIVNHIINLILGKIEATSLEEFVIEARNKARILFKDDKHIDELIEIVDLAIELSKNDDSDLNNIHKLGEGWVAEETLAIAIYCALKYKDDFSKAIITAVNHNGDSDSTGAVTGNILGAWVGYDAIENKWKDNLELHDLIFEIADDMNQGCLLDEYSDYEDWPWESKYCCMHRYKDKDEFIQWQRHNIL